MKNLNKSTKIYPNYIYYGEYKESLAPNDIDFLKQFHHRMIKTKEAWKVTKGTSEVIVAVTDNEFEIEHSDLKSSWWINSDEIPNNNIDDDGNGYIDDVYGWDFMGQDNDVDSSDQTTHGTHIAGIIAATVNNKIGGAGVSPGVKVMPLRWYGNERRWSTAIVLETYNYAIDNGAKIISKSYGIDGLSTDQAYLDVIQYAKSKEVLVINSAGNNNSKNPARQSVEDVILFCSVKSSDLGSSDKKSRFSNYGTGIDICAPGDPIYSTLQPLGRTVDRHGSLHGTSMSAPIVASVAALIWSVNPNYSYEEVRSKPIESVDEINSKNFWFKGMLGSGRINAYKAVK